MFSLESPQTWDYNCVAYAAAAENRIWWPTQSNTSKQHYYWPSGVRRDETIEAFIQAFRLFGYEPCDNAAFEESKDKVAIYTDTQGRPLHMAKQRSNGGWKSKLGPAWDIYHDNPECLEGDEYGHIAQILSRPAKG